MVNIANFASQQEQIVLELIFEGWSGRDRHATNQTTKVTKSNTGMYTKESSPLKYQTHILDTIFDRDSLNQDCFIEVPFRNTFQILLDIPRYNHV